MKGLFVGSFNPITIAHELIAKDLLDSNILKHIYFVPVNSKKTDLIMIEDRIKLINLIKNNQEDVINIYDYNTKGLFNYDVLKKITGKYNITHIIMGSDLFYRFNTFNNYELILKEYNLIIIKRDEEINKYQNDYYSSYQNKIILINKEYCGSSKIAKENLTNKNNYLNKKVLDYIKENNLYN